MIPRMPEVPSADELKRHEPAIEPVPAGVARPFWSVMIPIYNAREDYLRETLQSVLCQVPGAEEMQIEVLDNCSTAGDAEALVREIGGGRIAYHRHTHNLGIAGNSNACIERARGRWVHILHGDDTVRPEFYRRARSGIEDHPEAEALYVLKVDLHQAEELAVLQTSASAFSFALRPEGDNRIIDRTGYGQTINRVLERYLFPLEQILQIDRYPKPAPEIVPEGSPTVMWPDPNPALLPSPAPSPLPGESPAPAGSPQPSASAAAS